jgi:hypothetical protein
MKWPFRRKRHPYPRPDFIRHAELMGRLDECSKREDLALTLNRLNVITPDQMLERVFAAREDEIEALAELRWYSQADEKRTDLAMRRGWVAEPLTPLIDPAGSAFTETD